MSILFFFFSDLTHHITHRLSTITNNTNIHGTAITTMSIDVGNEEDGSEDGSEDEDGMIDGRTEGKMDGEDDIGSMVGQGSL